MNTDEQTQRALLGGGCFWCLEACYSRIDGVTQVTSGYAGGAASEANYSDVCSGTTTHVEVAQVDFDTQRINYASILQYFWRIHDPTQLNRQGGDEGTQYRSVIYYSNEEQREEALRSMAEEAKNHTNKIVTTVESAPQFYPAEKYHRDYFDQHPGAPYCVAVIRPKLRKAGLPS